MPDAEVLTALDGPAGHITLNRPRALHALNTAMCRAISDALVAWRDAPSVQIVMLDHAGERGFCAGGDIRMIAESGKRDGAEARAFFMAEYHLNHVLFTYPKPVVAFMDGVTMGGGVGLSAPAPLRIATERTLWAMPESGIGLFPDVGAGWYLPRLPGRVGLWLALTGARLKAADCVALGLCSHYVPSEALPAVKAAIAAGQPAEAVVTAASAHPGASYLLPNLAKIDHLFAADDLLGIVAALQADGSQFARDQLAILRSKSPQTLAVTVRQLKGGAAMTSFADEMAVEYRLGARIACSHDFIEGVRALIVDKDNQPRWSPATIEDLDPAAIEALFAPLGPGREWIPLV